MNAEKITSDFCEVVDKYFIEGTVFTVIIRNGNNEDPIVISCDNDLGKVIDALKESQKKIIAGK